MIALNNKNVPAKRQELCVAKRIGSVPGLARAVVIMTACICSFGALIARADTARPTRTEPAQGNSSQSARLSAIQSLPIDKLDVRERAKVHAVLSNITIFRRMPTRVVDCDPDLYLFIVRHPDVIVNIWNVLKISQLQLRETATNEFHLKEVGGIEADLRFLYSSHDTHLIYAEGVYEGTTFGRQVKGSGLFLLKSGYLRETDGRYYISSRLDSFISVEPSAVEMVAKAIHPLLGFTADNNFSQTVTFVGSLSRTAEQSNRNMQRLAKQLSNLQPDVRSQFAQLAEKISEKPSAVLLRELSDSKTVARKDDGNMQR